MMTRKLNCVIEANAILGFQSIVSSTNWIFEFDDDPFVSFPIEYFFSSMDFFFSNSCTVEEAEVISDGSGVPETWVSGFRSHSGSENLKKSRPKKVVKSNKSISRKIC